MSFEPSDEELMLLYQHGNNAAGALLFDRYQGPIFGYVLRMVRNQSDAEEVLQNVFLRMHEHKAQYRCDGRFRSWIFRIATTQTYNFLNARNRNNDRCVVTTRDGSESDREIQSNDTGPDKMMEAKDLADAVEKAILDLPEDYRTVFMLRQKEGLGYEEIATMVNKSPESLRVQFHRARKMLYKALKPWFEED